MRVRRISSSSVSTLRPRASRSRRPAPTRCSVWNGCAVRSRRGLRSLTLNRRAWARVTSPRKRGARESWLMADAIPPYRAPERLIVIFAAAHVKSAAGGGTSVETGGRGDHVRRTRSLSRRALGGDRDPGWLHRFRSRGAYPRDAGREPSRVARGCGGVPRGRHLDHAFCRHAGRAYTGGYRLPRSSHHRIVPDLRAGGRHILVFRQHW